MLNTVYYLLLVSVVFRVLFSVVPPVVSPDVCRFVCRIVFARSFTIRLIHRLTDNESRSWTLSAKEIGTTSAEA